MLALQQRQLVAAQLVHAQAQAQAAQAQAAQAAAAGVGIHHPGADPAARARYVVDKKQREVYVGNLTPGVASIDVVREVFDGALARVFPESVANGPAVINVNMDGSQKFCFVELRSEQLAYAALHLDKTDVGGRPMNVGRPKGYVEPPPGWIPSAVPANVVPGFDANASYPTGTAGTAGRAGTTGTAGMGMGMGMAGTTSAPSAPSAPSHPGGYGGSGYGGGYGASAASAAGAGMGAPTPFLRVEGAFPDPPPNDPSARAAVADDLRATCDAFGETTGTASMPPTASSAAAVIVAFADVAAAAKARAALHGEKNREGRILSASFVNGGTYAGAAGGGGWDA